MGLADKAIAGAIRGIAKAVGSAEKNVAGYVGQKVLDYRARGTPSTRYGIGAFLGKFMNASKEEVAKHRGSVANVVPRGYMMPYDLKFVKNAAAKNGEDVYLGGHKITDHWHSGNFKADHMEEYLPNGGTKVEWGPWWHGDMLRDPKWTLRKFKEDPFHRDKRFGGVGISLVRRSPYGPAELEMGREAIAGTAASGAAFWGAVSAMKRQNSNAIQQQQPPMEDSEDEQE